MTVRAALTARLIERGRQIDALRAEVTALRARVHSDDATTEVGGVRRASDDPSPALRLVAAAVGAAGGVALAAGRAGAADGDPVRAGQTTTAASPTTFAMTSGATNNAVLFASDRDLMFDPPFRSAIKAWSQRANGVLAMSTGLGAAGEQGSKTGYGLVAQGPRAELQLVDRGDPRNDTVEHGVNEIAAEDGELFHCIATGAPGTWRRLSGPSTAGALTPISPTRVYDSRKPNGTSPSGPISNGDERIVIIRDGRDPDTNAIDRPNVVPFAATAIVYNITIVAMTGAGYLSVEPLDRRAIGASTINWGPSTSGALANASLVKLVADAGLPNSGGDRAVKVFAGGGGSTHFIVDVLGYHI